MTTPEAKSVRPSQRDPRASNYDNRTLIFRAFLFVSYVCFGSGMFHLLERNEAPREVTRFEEHYNKTMKIILSRFVSNETEMKMLIDEIRRTFLQKSFPKEWDYLGGLNISVSAITTIVFVSVTTNTVSPLKKIVKLSFGVSKATYLPLDGSRYIQDGHIIGRTKPNLSPWYDPSYEKVECSIGGWLAKSFEKEETEIILFTHPQQKLAVFGFRGTEGTSLSDWMKNFKVALVDANVGSTEFKIHEGFRDRYREISSWFESEYEATPQDYTIILTGHSLGGALATISAVYVSGKLNRPPDAVISFASPLVGDQDFSNYYVKMVGCDHTLRITAKGDIIPTFRTSKRYTHVCGALEVDGSTGGWLTSWNVVKIHSLYHGYDKGLARKFPDVNEINFGCDKPF